MKKYKYLNDIVLIVVGILIAFVLSIVMVCSMLFISVERNNTKLEKTVNYGNSNYYIVSISVDDGGNYTSSFDGSI